MLLAVLTDFCKLKYVLDVVLVAFFRDSNRDRDTRYCHIFTHTKS
jgi:hypothetical protein